MSGISPRPVAAQALRAGAQASGGVSGKTDCPAAGKSPGSKLDKAREPGAEVIDEARLPAMLGGAGGGND